MGIKERKKRERDQRRELILSAANEILKNEGVKNLSIRKIAKKIEYSPAIIYHYFKDKNDIINHLMRKGYNNIVDGLLLVQKSTDKPKDKLANLIRMYINTALDMPDEYQTVLLTNSPEILEHTAWLSEGASSKKPALTILAQCIRDLYKDKFLDEKSIELTAQVIASASFGLIIRLILEKDYITQQQKEQLVEHHITCIIEGMLLRNPI